MSLIRTNTFISRNPCHIRAKPSTIPIHLTGASQLLLSSRDSTQYPNQFTCPVGILCTNWFRPRFLDQSLANRWITLRPIRIRPQIKTLSISIDFIIQSIPSSPICICLVDNRAKGSSMFERLDFGW